MADDSDDEDLAALRNAVLASMKSKPKAPPPRTQFGDADDIAALRAAALRTKKPTVEPANSHVYPSPTPIMPVESISGVVGHNSPYHDPQQPSSPHRQNFHSQQAPGSPHRHPPPPLRPGFVHRQGFPRGRGGFGPRNQFTPRGQSQFAPRNQAQFNARPAMSNLIVLTTAPEPPRKESDNRKAPATKAPPTTQSAAVSALMVRPQDKWSGSGSAASEPPKPEKPKGPARFSRLESDSDSDESDMEYGISSSKDTPSSSSSSSEDEQENDKDTDGSDHENGSPKLKESAMEEHAKSPSPAEPKEDVKMESPSSPSESKPAVRDASPKDIPSGSPPDTGLTKPDYTRVPPPALSPAPSPKRNSSPPAPTRPPVTSRLATKSHPPETSSREQSRKLSNSQDVHSNNSSVSGITSKMQCRAPTVTKPDSKDQAVLEARRRKFESVPSEDRQNAPKTISLHSGGRKPQDAKSGRKDGPTRELVTKDTKGTDKKVNGRSKAVSPSRSSNSSSQSESSDSDSSSSNTISPSDSDSDSDSGRRDKHKAIERGKDDIDRERRQREAREREERRASRQGKGRETGATERSHRKHDESRLPRSYSKIQNEPERRRTPELPAQYRKQYPEKQRNQSKGSSQDLSRRDKYRREEREYHQSDQSRDDQKYRSARREEPRREQGRRDDLRYDKGRREESHTEKDKRDESRNDQGTKEKTNRRDDQKRRVVEEPPRERSKREEAFKQDESRQNQQGRLDDSSRVSEDLRNKVVSKDDLRNRGVSKDDLRNKVISKDDLRNKVVSKDDLRNKVVSKKDLRNKVVSKDGVSSSRKAKRSRTPDSLSSDTDRPVQQLQETFSGGESDLSELSDIDSPPQKLRSVTRIVKDQANRDNSPTSHSAKDIVHSSRDSRSQRSSERREPSADSSGSHKKTGEEKSGRIIVDDHKRGKKSLDAREIICKLKGERAESPSNEKIEPVKHNPQISITFNKDTVHDEPPLDVKPSKGRLSVHERLGMPVKHKPDNAFESAELSPEPKITRRVITEDPTNVRQHRKKRRKDREPESDEETKRGTDGRKNTSSGEDKPKKDKKKHKKKDYNIWSSHRAVTVDHGADIDDTSEHDEPATHYSIEHRLGKVVKERSASPEPELQDVRSRLTQKRKKRSIGERLGVQSVIATPPQPIAEQGPERKRAKLQKENTKQAGTEGDLNEKIRRIQEQNEVIRRRKEEVDRDKQRYS